MCVLCVCMCMHATCLWHITCTQPWVTVKGFFQTAVSTWIRPEIEVKLNHTTAYIWFKLPQLWNIYKLWQGRLHAHRRHWVIMYSGQVRTMHEQSSVIQFMILVWSPFLCSYSSSRGWTSCYIVSSVVIYLYWNIVRDMKTWPPYHTHVTVCTWLIQLNNTLSAQAAACMACVTMP